MIAETLPLIILPTDSDSGRLPLNRHPYILPVITAHIPPKYAGCAEVYADREVIPDRERLQALVDGVNLTLPSFKQMGRVTLRTEPFEKTSTQKIYRRGA